MSPALKYTFDEFEADVNAAELRRNGNRLKVQMQPFQVLVALLERPREVVSREDLRLRLWPEDTFVDFDHSLNTAMVKLREVLGDSAASPRYIETIAKRGYRFLGDVQVVQDKVAMVVPPAPGIASPTGLATAASVDDRARMERGAGVLPEVELPRASRRTTRTLFVLVQIM